jgi:5'-nucleotidase
VKTISVDMDGVLADVYSQFIKMHAAESGEILVLKNLDGLAEFQAFKYGSKHVRSENFFRTAPLMNKSQEILKKLNERYRVFIVSSATEFPNSLIEKQSWLNEHFPFISWQQMVFCGSKEIIKADIMIDDHFKNLDHFDGQTILFTQPHNKLNHDHTHTRVNSWEEIEKILLS